MVEPQKENQCLKCTISNTGNQGGALEVKAERSKEKEP